MDVWQVHMTPVWAEFVGSSLYYATDTAPLLLDTPVSAWLVQEGSRWVGVWMSGMWVLL